MTVTTLYTQQLMLGNDLLDNQLITLSEGKVIAIAQSNKESAQKADYCLNGLVVAGFIDLQVNGGGGVLLNNDPCITGLKTMMSAHAAFGTTGMLPTFISDNAQKMQQVSDVIAQAIKEQVPGILGIHFEGPFLSIAKKGTHSAEFIRSITPEEWQILSRKDIGKVMVTLAPETVSCDDIEKMVSLGITVCLGHTNADYQTAQRAVDAGASGFTHVFNAMSPLQGREPGVVGCALLNDHTSCGLIVDGHHVDYASCQLAVKTKPQGKIFLVTDAMSPVGTKEQSFAFFDRTVTLNAGKLTSSTGELAGSVLTMIEAVKNTVRHLNVSLLEAVKMASQYPADFLYQTTENPYSNGCLAIGSPADFVLLDENKNVLETWINGVQIYKK